MAIRKESLALDRGRILPSRFAWLLPDSLYQNPDIVLTTRMARQASTVGSTVSAEPVGRAL